MKRIFILIALAGFLSADSMALTFAASDITASSVSFDKGRKKKKTGDCCKKDASACCKKATEEGKTSTEKPAQKGACCKKDAAATCTPASGSK